MVGGRDGHQAEAADAAAGVPSCNIKSLHPDRAEAQQPHEVGT